MATISVCMIVKNEEEKLRDCLESLKEIADEIIVVDTGSIDKTKEIAGIYTDRIYDFKWTGSFSDARNYAFSLATCDYIYSADADEVIDGENIKKFLMLKQVIDLDIDIVQMYYCNQLSNNTIYSFDRELRPKLYKRIREWKWESSIHEEVRRVPVIYDSDIEIIHNPGAGHGSRDLAVFESMIERGEELSPRLLEIYCKELIIAGKQENFILATDYFATLCEQEELQGDMAYRIFTMAAISKKKAGDLTDFMKYALRAAAGQLMTSELCYELGDYYEALGDINEAVMWYYNAANETSAYMDIKYEKKLPLEKLETFDSHGICSYNT